MCGRFVITEAADEMARLFEAIPANDLPQVPNHNVCPTNQIHVVLGGEGRRLTSMRWGLIPHWYKSPGDGPLLINARAETIAEKPAFRSAARERRCIVPATGFYEWTKDADNKRLPWYIRPSGGGPIAFAAIWQEWRHGDDLMNTCAIVTTSANAAMAKIHHRMPVCLSPEDWPLWLGEAGKGAAMLMRPAPESYLDFWRVDPRVNSNRASGCELIEPISA